MRSILLFKILKLDESFFSKLQVTVINKKRSFDAVTGNNVFLLANMACSFSIRTYSACCSNQDGCCGVNIFVTSLFVDDLSSLSYNVCHCFDVDKKLSWNCTSVGFYRQKPCGDVAFSEDGSVLAVVFKDVITLWDPEYNSMHRDVISLPISQVTIR